jgi:hypothetical protein
MAQIVECLPNKCEALSSNPLPTKKKKDAQRELYVMAHKCSNTYC